MSIVQLHTSTKKKSSTARRAAEVYFYVPLVGGWLDASQPFPLGGGVGLRGCFPSLSLCAGSSAAQTPDQHSMGIPSHAGRSGAVVHQSCGAGATPRPGGGKERAIVCCQGGDQHSGPPPRHRGGGPRPQNAAPGGGPRRQAGWALPVLPAAAAQRRGGPIRLGPGVSLHVAGTLQVPGADTSFVRFAPMEGSLSCAFFSPSLPIERPSGASAGTICFVVVIAPP